MHNIPSDDWVFIALIVAVAVVRIVRWVMIGLSGKTAVEFDPED